MIVLIVQTCPLDYYSGDIEIVMKGVAGEIAGYFTVGKICKTFD